MESKNGNTNFWISYADLMAGLLFVFILLIGAIIVKYSLLQSESEQLEKNLEKEHLALIQKDERIKKIVDDLKEAKKHLKNRLIENEKLQLTLNEKEKSISSFLLSNKELKEKLKSLDEKKKELLENIDKLDKEVKSKDDKISSFEKENSDYKNKLTQLALEKENLQLDIEKLNSMSDEKESKLNKLLEDLLIKQKLIDSFKEKNTLLDDELKTMEQKLASSKQKEQKLTSELSNTKEKIKSFTGIKVKVISHLKSKLGNSIEIDPRNGSLRLSSNILFDEGKYILKDTAKKALKIAVYDYFQTILDNEEINKHIDKIVIEGHTNSKGNYLYNLELSQKRAYSVMDFLLTLDFNKQENLKELIAASGRSFLDPIYDKNGKEDPDASRRIEIKLSLKNEQAIKEIANLLE